MENNEIKLVEMTPAQAEEFAAFKKEQEAKKLLENQKNQRESYKELVHDTVNESFDQLMDISQLLQDKKKIILDSFKTAIDMKLELFSVKDGQLSHTFSNKNSDKRIAIGYYTVDSYDDTVSEGIAIVKEVVSSLANSDESQALVNTILSLLSKDQKGNLKPSRVLQLKKLAEEIENKRLREGIAIIVDAYKPTVSKVFVKAEFKNENNAWVSIPLGITEA